MSESVRVASLTLACTALVSGSLGLSRWKSTRAASLARYVHETMCAVWLALFVSAWGE